jgi:hypothetical protein
MLVALLCCAVASRQSEVLETQPETFHAHGAIRAYAGSAVPGAEVIFEGRTFSKKVSADDKGFYEIDLPVGLYTLTVQPLGQYLQAFRRPLFRVASPVNLTLNASLERPGPICDKLIPFPDGARNVDSDVVACGGQDLFSVPSEDKIPFQLLIRYQTRRHSSQGRVYSSDKVPPGLEVPVFVAYNLFTLYAATVVYDVPNRKLRATGNVFVEDANGSTQTVDSMTFKIENGEASPIPSEPANP